MTDRRHQQRANAGGLEYLAAAARIDQHVGCGLRRAVLGASVYGIALTRQARANELDAKAGARGDDDLVAFDHLHRHARSACQLERTFCDHAYRLVRVEVERAELRLQLDERPQPLGVLTLLVLGGLQSRDVDGAGHHNLDLPLLAYPPHAPPIPPPPPPP